MKRYDVMLEWLAGIYVNTLDLIQYMHDKYYYEAAEMLSSIPTYAAPSLPASQASHT